MTKATRLSAICFTGLLFTTGTFADVISDPAGDFLSTLTPLAPRAPDMDVISSQVSLSGSNLLLSATLAGAVNTTPEAFYVWGVDRGSAASNFAELGLPNITFDAVVIVQNEGTGMVNDLTGIQPPATLPAGSITVSGNTIAATVPLSFLPSRGFAPEQYGWNLWPRWGGIPFSDPQIADFAPDDHDALVNSASVPEPGTLVLLSVGLAMGAAIQRKRNRT